MNKRSYQLTIYTVDPPSFCRPTIYLNNYSVHQVPEAYSSKHDIFVWEFSIFIIGHPNCLRIKQKFPVYQIYCQSSIWNRKLMLIIQRIKYFVSVLILQLLLFVHQWIEFIWLKFHLLMQVRCAAKQLNFIRVLKYISFHFISFRL